MPDKSKFGGVPVEESAPAGGSRFGGVPVEDAPVKSAPAATPQSKGFLGELWNEVKSGPANILAAGNAINDAVLHPYRTIQGMGQQIQDTATKAKESFQRGDYLGAGRHALNTGINSVAPGLGTSSDEAGDMYERGDYAGGTGKTLGMGANLAVGLKTPKIAAAVANAPEAAITMARTQIPDALERSAANSYRRMLAPTGKQTVPEAERIAAGLVKSRPKALTQDSMVRKLDATAKEVGPRARVAYDEKPALDPNPILERIEKLRQEKAVVKGTEVIADESLDKALSNIRDNIEAMRDADGNVAANALDDYRGKLFKGNVGATGHMRASSPASASAIEKSVAGSIKNHLDTIYPEVKPINDAYSTAAGAKNFLENRRRAEIAAESGVKTGSSSGFGAALKKVVPAPLRSIPTALGAATDSVAWDSTMGAGKAALADRLRNAGLSSRLLDPRPRRPNPPLLGPR